MPPPPPQTLTEHSNHLLNALKLYSAVGDYADLELVEIPLGQMLYEAGDKLLYAYFPTSAVVSLLLVLEDGNATEIAVVGNEGMLGIALSMGGEKALNRAVVQSAGYGYRLKAQLLKDEFNNASPGIRLLLRYAQAPISQIAQTAVCNRHHSIRQQVCRLLLLSMDRLHSHELTLTHEHIANLLGVRREGVTEVAIHLHALGLIDYSRGKITVLNKAGLQQACCECYKTVQTEFDRLLPELKTRAHA